MKIIKNVLSQELVDECVANTKEKFKDRYCWGVDIFNWEDKLTKGTNGVCLFTPVVESLREKIENAIKEHLPDYEYLLLQHYVWTRGSGIARHNDGNYKFGATIYLNQNWDIDYGGIFLWKEKDVEEYNVVCPEFNTMVLNNDQTVHMVTPVALDAPEFRVSIQIWAN